MESRSGGGTEEFIKTNIKNERRESKDKDRGRARGRELYKKKKKKKKSLHDSSYRFPQTVGVVKAG